MRRKPSTPGPIYELKVTLLGSEPPIWRRLQVPASTTLAHLHEILQVAMGWEDEHLHQFIVGEGYYGPRSAMTDLAMSDERRARLDQVLKAPQERMIYEYDFGDSWQHEVLLEKVLTREPGVTYPRVVEGRRAGPPEDVGGVYGYEDLLEAIANPKHPEHEDMLEWLGEEFDPEAFDLEAANAQLQYLK
jgi:hypothetical protein